MKNKGIVISGGEVNATNLAVGDNAKIELAHESPSVKKAVSPETFAFVANIKQLIAQGEVREAIQELLLHFKSSENKAALNAVIMHSSSFTQLEMQENLNVISHEQARIDRAKVTNAVLQLIDNEINK